MNAMLHRRLEPSSLATQADRPLRIAFVITSMPVGGAETLLVNLLRSFDPTRIQPQVVCLKEPGLLGESLATEFPVHHHLLRHRWDAPVLLRLRGLLRAERLDGVVTVGAGDKMFWGRLAARSLGLPIVISALHSTGWPDGVGRLNRWLTPLTDAFVGVAHSHGQFLVEQERFPAAKVRVIPNGIDTDRFKFSADARADQRRQWGWTEATPVCGVVAALRPEKNLSLFLRTAALVVAQRPDARFVIVGSGVEAAALRALAEACALTPYVRFLGMRQDTPQVLSGLDLFALTSDNEASPVSILEAMSVQRPVVATRVGSVPETVIPDETGLLVPTGDSAGMAQAWLRILSDRTWGQRLGDQGRRRVIEHHSLRSMTAGYTTLLEDIFIRKSAAVCPRHGGALTVPH
jgi:glycosyltransferase involved in cell wall biosynthesis